MVEIEIVRDPDEIVKLKKDWDALFLSGKCEPSLSYDWTQALLETHVLGEEVLVIVLRRFKEILGIVPLVITTKTKFGVALRHLIPVGEMYNTHSDLLIKDSSSDLIEGFLSALLILGKKWDIFHMGRFAENNLVFEEIQKYLRSSSVFRYDSKPEEPSYFVPLDCSFSEYLRKRSSNFRSSLSKNEKKTHKAGKVTIKTNQEFKSFDEAYGHILKIEEKSWKHKQGTAISSIRKQSDFYKMVYQNVFEKGWAHLSILYLNDEPVAYNMGLVKNEIYYYLKTSFDEDFRNLGLSGLLRAKLIENLINKEIKEMDFTGEPYEWQRHWTENVRGHHSVWIYNQTWRGKCFSIYNRRKRTVFLPGGATEKEVRFHDPRELKPDRN